MRLRRVAGAPFLVMGVLGLLAGPADAKGLEGMVVELTLDGVVDPFAASYLKSGLGDANANGAAAVLITIDTPGGLDSSMREITQAILDSDIPVICYVAPPGARAASAGTFVLLSCPVAAMAPGTNVGAAHPVGLAGAIDSEKATNDAAAYIRSLAETYGRNADWAESAVRDSVSATAEEALDLDVIDLIAATNDELFAALPGTSVTLGDGTPYVFTDAIADPSFEQQEMNPVFAFLHGLLNPNVAFIFFWLGLGLILLEFFIPGGVVGILGAIMFILAIAAFGMLPIQLLGVGLLIASVVFFLLELKHPGIGVPSIGGAICLVAGGLLLFSPSVPNSRVSPWIIAVSTAGAVVFFAIVVRAAMRARQLPPPPGHAEQMVGREGTVAKALDPEGVVQVASESWTATSETRLPKGRRIRVVAADGLRLKVEPADEVPVGSGERTDEGGN
ncbi:MAG: nodulation protein NfeD [Actinomycetota bacterium]